MAANEIQRLFELEKDIECSICSEHLTQSTVIDCGHEYCSKCINDWKNNNSQCPVCRKDFTVMISVSKHDTLIKNYMFLLKRERQFLKMQQDYQNLKSKFDSILGFTKSIKENVDSIEGVCNSEIEVHNAKGDNPHEEKKEQNSNPANNKNKNKPKKQAPESNKNPAQDSKLEKAAEIFAQVRDNPPNPKKDKKKNKENSDKEIEEKKQGKQKNNDDKDSWDFDDIQWGNRGGFRPWGRGDGARGGFRGETNRGGFRGETNRGGFRGRAERGRGDRGDRGKEVRGRGDRGRGDRGRGRGDRGRGDRGRGKGKGGDIGVDDWGYKEEGKRGRGGKNRGGRGKGFRNKNQYQDNDDDWVTCSDDCSSSDF